MAVAVGLFGGLFSSAIFIGMVDQRLSDAIRIEVSNLQIHAPGFTSNRELSDTIPEAMKIAGFLKQNSSVKAFSARLKTMAMASTASGATGIMLNGVDPDQEKETTSIHAQIPDSLGTWFTSGKKNPIVIGSKLAEKLKVKLHSKIILSFQTIDKQIAYGAFRIEGIYKTFNSSFDEINAFIRYEDFAGLANLTDHQVHEFLVSLHDDRVNESVVKSLREAFPKAEIMGWKECMPDLGLMAEYTNTWLYIILVIILLALSFGIINTMMMAVLERRREIGMLRAVGMSKRRVFALIMLETVFLSLTGAIVSIVVTIPLVHYFGSHGLNALAFAKGFEDIGFAAIIYPRLSIDSYAGLTILVMVSAIIASIGPARKALSLNPVEAIRTL